MENIIQAIIASVTDQQEAETRERQQNYQALLNQAREELRKVFDQVDGLYETLQPYIQEDFDLGKNYSDLHVSLTWEIVSDELQLSPITARISVPRVYSRNYLYVNGGQYEYAAIQKVIAISRVKYDGWKNEQAKKFISDRSNKFYFWHQRDQGVMETAYNELIAKFPGRKGEFDQMRKEWEDTKALADQRAEEERESQEQKQEAKERFLHQLVSYYSKYNTRLVSNKQKAQPLQEALDKPFEAFHLRYGIVGSDDQETYVDTSSEWVTAEKPDETGYWTTFAGKQIKYLHPVSIEKRTIKPSDQINGLYWKQTFTQYGITLVMARHLDDDVNGEIHLYGFDELPERPKRPDVLSWGEDESLDRLARKQLGEDVELTWEDEAEF